MGGRTESLRPASDGHRETIIGMVETSECQGRSAQGWTNFIIGLLVFALGIVLMLAAFYWGYNMLRGVDDEVRSVQTVQAADNPAAPASGTPGSQPAVVQATPPPAGGPTLLEVAAGYVLKLVVLLVLALIGAMTASKGAQLAGTKVG